MYWPTGHGSASRSCQRSLKGSLPKVVLPEPPKTSMCPWRMTAPNSHLADGALPLVVNNCHYPEDDESM
eukprot:1744161-Amphidinium_carterae.1